MKFRTKQFEIEAIQFTDSSIEKFYEISKFTNGQFHLVGNGDMDAEVYDYLHDTWVGLKKSQWIIRGMKNEYYPCDDEVFRAKYEEIL